MANITNSQAIRFCNRNARPLADLVAKTDRTITQFLLNVTRDFETPCSANLNTDAILDGATTADNLHEDGRPKITKAEIASLKAVLQAIKDVMDTGSNRSTIRKWSSNDTPLF